MRRLARARLAFPLLAGLVLTCWSQPGRTAEPERIKFDTYDQVEIHATYFPGDSGNKSPCALVLHALGGSSREEGWDNLAKELQKRHFAVLLFDFRGHGDSTSVAMDFWRLDRNNQTLKSFKPGKPRDQISYKDFTTLANWLSLVNDIEAAKRFLDRKNDNGECNSGNLCVIGAESSAWLGLLWIAMQWAPEWQRYRTVVPLSPLTAQRNHIGGPDISCAVWLSFNPQIAVEKAKYTLHPDSWLAAPVREKVPMYFLYGEQDNKAKATAQHLYDGVLHARKDKKLKLTAERAIKNTKLAGRELFTSPETIDLVLTYVTKVMEERGSSTWTKRDVDRTVPVRVPVERFVR